MTLKTTPDAISSQESDCGIMLLTSHDGKKIVPFGQAHVPVSRSVLQVDKQVKKTIATYGPNGSGSSRSVNLQLSLENRLRMQLPTGGLTMFIKGWKRKSTPLGVLYCQLAPSVRPIDENDYGLWPTPQARDFRTGEAKRWYDKKRSQNLNDAAVALWATPNTMDNLPQRSKEAMDRQFNTTRKGRTAPANLREQVIPAMWPTPRVGGEEGAETLIKRKGLDAAISYNLKAAVDIAMWPTPNASDHRDRGSYDDPCIQRRVAKGKQIGLSMIAQGTGKMEHGSTAPTGSKGSLNPQFPCWLMGIPKEWVLSIVRGMQSYRK